MENKEAQANVNNDVQWITLDQAALELGLACHNDALPAIKATPIIFQARNSGSSTEEVLTRLTACGVTAEEAASLLGHYLDAEQIVVNYENARREAQTEEDFWRGAKAGRLNDDQVGLAAELINTAAFRFKVFLEGGDREQFPSHYEHIFIFHIAYCRAARTLLEYDNLFVQSAYGASLKDKMKFAFYPSSSFHSQPSSGSSIWRKIKAAFKSE